VVLEDFNRDVGIETVIKKKKLLKFKNLNIMQTSP
jgi:hypothetical protein